jgi:ABC-type lipoprotein release transport system permease subunit
LNHLLPILRQRVRWEAYGGEVVIVGIEGEIYIKSPRKQAPIEEAIAPGQVHLGDAVRRRLNAAEGRPVDLLGTRFVVRRLLPPNGTADDVAVLMNLGDAQRLLGRADQVGGIMALSCDCAAGDLEPIRRDVQRVLPGAQVVEFAVRARARQQARMAAAQTSRAEIDDVRASRDAVRIQLAVFARALVTLVAVSSMLLLAALATANARERRGEVAIWRALGLSTVNVLALFLVRGGLTGALGGVLGTGVGVLTARVAAGVPPRELPPMLLAGAAALALAVAVLATLLPAWYASRQDPAPILNEE